MAKREVTLRLSTREEKMLSETMAYLCRLEIDEGLPLPLEDYADEIVSVNAALNDMRDRL